MATNWRVPVVSDQQNDVQIFCAQAIFNGADEPDSGGQISVVTDILQAVVDRVRGAINSGHRVPLSLTVGSVPPEAFQHVIVETVAGMINRIPDFSRWADSPLFKTQFDAAEAWIESVMKGDMTVTIPTDPDPNYIGSEWGDFSGQEVAGVAGQVDMTTGA